MNDLLNSIDNAIENKNYYAALFISLTLPDICGKIQFPEIKSSKKRYIDWFNVYLKDTYINIHPNCVPFLTGEDLYSFRCSLLHEGSENISKQARQILTKFILVENGPHLNLFFNDGDGILQLNIVNFCIEICSGVNNWLNDFKDNPIFIEYRSRLMKIYPSGTIINGIKFG